MSKNVEKTEGINQQEVEVKSPQTDPSVNKTLSSGDGSLQAAERETEKSPEAEAAANVNAAEVLAAAGDETIRNAAETSNALGSDFANQGDKAEVEGLEGWKVGQEAPATKWLDKDGVTVLDEPRFTDGTGFRLVREGERVSQSVLDRLKAGLKK